MLIKSVLLIALSFFLLHFSAAAQPEKWTTLFDGKTLQGWTKKGGTALYAVKDGAIVGTCVDQSPNTFLCTERQYGDFILEVELRVEGTLNSGLQIRTNSRPDYKNGQVHGLQVEVDPSKRAWSGGIYDEGRRDWLYIPNINPAGKAALHPGEWNKYRIEAIGKEIRTWINDVPVAHLVDSLQETGFIALQVHAPRAGGDDVGKQIHWRSVRMQTGANLRPRPATDCPILNFNLNDLTAAEKAQGWRLLFNGNDLSGWRSAFKTQAPAAGWQVTNGLLTLSGSNGSESTSYGDLVTTENYGFFELSFDFRLTEGANSGVKYFVDEKLDAAGGSAIGLEYQLLDDERHPDARLGAAGNRTLASLYDLIPAYKLEKRFQRRITDWQSGRIVVRPDNIVQHWLNGFLVVEYERKSNIFAALVARSKYKDWVGFGLNDAGPILLQDHGHAVAFKNMKIRKIR